MTGINYEATSLSSDRILNPRNAAPKIGFSELSPSSDPLAHSRLATIIPTEIVNRFAPPLLILPRLERSHYLQMWKWAEVKLTPQVRKVARRLALDSIDKAVSEQLGFRWIEQIMLEWLVSQYRISSAPEAGLQAAQK